MAPGEAVAGPEGGAGGGFGAGGGRPVVAESGLEPPDVGELDPSFASAGIEGSSREASSKARMAASSDAA